MFVPDAETDHARLLRLRDQAGAGELTLCMADVVPANQAADTHRRLAGDGVLYQVLSHVKSGAC